MSVKGKNTSHRLNHLIVGQHMQYRPEIDGLRAMSVVSVLLFHAGFENFSGGYVGVDIFFVISGYLITLIILGDIEKQRFSIKTFYERRARRILPVLFFVLFVSSIASLFILTPHEIERFSKSLLSVLLFVSNIFFWTESKYFGAAAELKPLLHSWSLSVEEQFYILFPVFLLIGMKFFKKFVLAILVTVFVASLFLAEWASYDMAGANFYLTPTRVWELLAGAGVAFFSFKKGEHYNQLLATIGVGLMLYAIFAFDEQTRHPSALTLVPIVGTCLFLLYCDCKRYPGKIFTSSIAVSIGLISYSLYLWHQPMFAFARHLGFSTNDLPIALLLMAACFPLSWISWKFIEVPFRRAESMRAKQLFLTLGVSAVILIVFGGVGINTSGYKTVVLELRHSEQDRPLYRALYDAIGYDLRGKMVQKPCQFWVDTVGHIDNGRLKDCRKLHGKATVILGDSHAMNLYNIVAISDKKPFVIGVARQGCRPHNPRTICPYEPFKLWLEKHKNTVGVIIYHQSGSYLIADEKGAVDSQLAFENLSYSFSEKNTTMVIEYLNVLSDKSIELLWLGPFVEYRKNPLTEVDMGNILIVDDGVWAIFEELDLFLLEQTKGKLKGKYLPFSSVYEQPKQVFYHDCFIYRDGDHYSRCGEFRVAKSGKDSRF